MFKPFDVERNMKPCFKNKSMWIDDRFLLAKPPRSPICLQRGSSFRTASGLAEGFRWDSIDALKDARKMIRIGKAEFFCDLLNQQVAIAQ